MAKTNLVATASSLLSVKLTLDGGTRPGTIGHYKIERTRSGFTDYLVIYETELALLYDHPRAWYADSLGASTGIPWRYRAYAYVTATGIYDDVSDEWVINIATPTNTQIDYSGVLEPATSAGTFSNTYLAQTEAKPTIGADVQETWAIIGILPLSVSSA